MQSIKVNKTTMTEHDFRVMRFGQVGLPQVRSLERYFGQPLKWELVGTWGVYQDPAGVSEFEDVAILHALIRRSGFTRFPQDGVMKYFPEDPDHPH